MQLPQGPPPEYKVRLFVQIIDDGDGITVYDINEDIFVYPNSAESNKLVDDVLNNPNSSYLNTLQTGNLQSIGQQMSSFTSTLNMVASADQPDQQADKRGMVRDILMNSVGSMNASDMSGVKVIASMLSSISGSVDEISLTSAVSDASWKSSFLLELSQLDL